MEALTIETDGDAIQIHPDYKKVDADISNSDEVDEISSIHSYCGNVADITTDELAYHELGETEEIRERSLEKIRTWVISQPHMKGCCRNDANLRLDQPQSEYGNSILLRFLRVNKFSIRKATAMLDSYIKMRCDFPQWYKGLGNWEEERFMELIDSGYIFVAPGRDKLGRKVVVNIARECDPTKYNSSDIMRAVMATVETLFIMDEETQIRGLSYIFYCKGLTFSHARLFSPLDMARMFTGCDHNIPLRHRAMFIVSMPFGMGRLLDLGKTFLGPVKKRIHVVSNVSNLLETSNGLLNDPDIVPIDIMGEDGRYTAKEMAAIWRQHIESHKTYLQNIDDLILTPVEKQEKVEDSKKNDQQSESKKAWFGLWSK